MVETLGWAPEVVVVVVVVNDEARVVVACERGACTKPWSVACH